MCSFIYEIGQFLIFASPSPGPVPIAKSGIPTTSLRLMAAPGPAFAGAMIAEKAGLFERNGIHVDIKAGADVNGPIVSVVSGADTFGITRADTFLKERANGARIVAFASGFVEDPAALFVLQKSGLQKPWDFVGHRIGRRASDDTSMIYDSLMKRLGLPQSRITEVPVGSALSMLLEGVVDVWPGHVGNEDYTLEKKNVPYLMISPDSYGVHAIGTVYITSEQTLAEKPELIRRFLSGLIAGWNMVYSNYAFSVPMIRSFDQSRLTGDYVRFVLDRQRQYLRPMALRYGEFDEEQWRSLEDMLLSQHLLKRTVDLSEAVTHGILSDVYRRPIGFGD